MAEKMILLIRKCRLNQEEAQRDLYDTFFEFARVICSGYSEQRTEQLEIAELGFKKVFKYIYSADTGSKQVMVEFKQWFRKMMIYAAVEYYRNSFNCTCFLQLDPYKLQTFVRSYNKNLNPTLKELKRVISMLPSSNKLILHLMTIQGFSSREIAQCLEISPVNAEMLINKSNENMRQLLIKQKLPEMSVHADYISR